MILHCKVEMYNVNIASIFQRNIIHPTLQNLKICNYNVNTILIERNFYRSIEPATCKNSLVLYYYDTRDIFGV